MFGFWSASCPFQTRTTKTYPKFRCVCTALFWKGLLEASQVIPEFGFGLGRTLKHICHGHTFHYPRVIQALSCLDLDPSRSGAATISLGSGLVLALGGSLHPPPSAAAIPVSPTPSQGSRGVKAPSKHSFAGGCGVPGAPNEYAGVGLRG